MNWLAVLDVAMPGPKVTPDEKGFAGWIIGVIVAALIIVTVSVVCIRKSIKKHKEAEAAGKLQDETAIAQEEQTKEE
ncbi:MAG: hypothetical protein J6X08_07370 [Lachnospiraceae bacterium]|nr:hypothetical protein [Lachnospiraceae bacterium]